MKDFRRRMVGNSIVDFLKYVPDLGCLSLGPLIYRRGKASLSKIQKYLTRNDIRIMVINMEFSEFRNSFKRTCLRQ